MSVLPDADDSYGRFGKLSAAYDAARREFPGETIAFVVDHLPGPHPFVLDLACGTGISARQLAARGVAVIGCDIDPRMVRYATGRGGGINYLIGRAEAIPLRDSIFDAVACFRAYHWFEPARAMPEMMRVLRPAGRVVISNMVGRGTLYDDFRRLVAQFVGSDLPDHRRTYDPRRDLAAHGLKVIAEHGELEFQTFTVPEMIIQFQSVSVWNLIPQNRLDLALEALEKFCRDKAANGVITREFEIETLIAAR